MRENDRGPRTKDIVKRRGVQNRERQEGTDDKDGSITYRQRSKSRVQFSVQ